MNISNNIDNKESPYICRDSDGNVLISVTDTDENALAENKQLTHCLAVVKIGSDYLLGWNKWRSRYEIFGGCIEPRESPGNCIIRECYEELGITNEKYTYLGAMKVLMMPDWFSNSERIEYGGLYGITLQDIAIEDIYKQINDKEEILKLALYSQIKGIEPIAQIDEVLLKYY